MTLAELAVKIKVDQAGLSSGLSQAQSSISKSEVAMTSAFKRIGIAAAAAFSVGAIVSFGKSVVKSASDAQETTQKFGAVFSNVAEQAQKDAKILADSYNMSNQASKELLASTGAILESFGFTQKAALDSSFEVNKLAADLVSFSNSSMGVKGASDAITKALLGERGQLKMLGVAISDVDLIEYAKQQGLVWNALDRRKQAELTMQLIMQRTKLQQGDVNRYIDTYAYQLRGVQKNIDNLSVAVGQSLLPFATVALRVFNELTPSMENAAKALKDYVTSAEGADNISTALAGIATVGKAFIAVYSVAGDIISEGIKDIIAPLKSIIKPLGDTNDKWAIFARVLSVGALPLLLTVNTTIGLVKIFINLANVLVQVGTAASAFFGGLKSGDWTDFYAKTKNVGSAVLGVGAEIKNLALSTKNLVTDAFDEKDIKKKSDALASAFSGAQQIIYKSLTANSSIVGANLDSKGRQIEKITNLTKAWALSVETVGEMTNALNGLLSAGAQLAQTISDNKIRDNEAAMNDELQRRGLLDADATARAEQDLAKAQASGDAERIRIAQAALERSKIEEKFAKKRRQLEYEGATAVWGFQVAQATAAAPLAVLNAFASGSKYDPAYGIIMAAAAAATAGIQLAAVVASKPQKPKFASGGIVGGESYYGDNVNAMVNSGEMVLNKDQQSRLFAQANGNGSGMMRVAPISKESLLDVLFRASQNGELFISERAVVAR